MVRILARGMTGVVGTYQQNKSFGFVIPDNSRFGRDIFVPGEKAGGAVSGSKVIVEITDYGGPGKCPEGRVAEILGHANDPGVDILSIVKSCGIPDAFPPEALSEAEARGGRIRRERVCPGPCGGRAGGGSACRRRNRFRILRRGRREDLSSRLDLRELPMVTIDGEDAKDLDDAVSLYRKDGQYHLGVHIADVSHYVKEGSAARHQRVSGGPGDPHAAPRAVKRRLLPERGGGQAGAQLPDDAERTGRGDGLYHRPVRDPGEGTDDLYLCGGDPGKGRPGGIGPL